MSITEPSTAGAATGPAAQSDADANAAASARRAAKATAPAANPDTAPADDDAIRAARRRALGGSLSAQVERHTTAPPERVWAILSDAWTYAMWVVGSTRIRAAAAQWPAVNSTLEHSVGIWPAVVDDCTISHGIHGHTLRLEARGQFLGRALVEITVLPGDDGGSRLLMTEEPLTRPARLVPGPLRHSMLKLRNAECLNRLALLAERRTFDPA